MPDKSKVRKKHSCTEKARVFTVVLRQQPERPSSCNKGMQITCVPIREWRITVNLFDPQNGVVSCRMNFRIKDQCEFDPMLVQNAYDRFVREMYSGGIKCLDKVEVMEEFRKVLGRRGIL